nr:MAG TPA: hypothetical protein [Bacteriophage sp.]
MCPFFYWLSIYAICLSNSLSIPFIICVLSISIFVFVFISSYPLTSLIPCAM